MTPADTMAVPLGAVGVARAEVWIGDRPPEGVIGELREARRALGVELPNNESDRFFATCAAINGARPVVARVTLDGGQAGLVLGRIARRRDTLRLGFVRIPGPRASTVDVIRGGLLAPPGCERECARAFAAAMWARKVRRIVWNALPTGSPGHEGVRALGRCIASPPQDRYWLRMEPGGDHPLAHRSSKSRSKIRRYDRLLVEHFAGDVRMEQITRPEQVAGFCAACDAISRASYHEKIGYGVRDNTLWRSMLTAAAESGALRSYLLVCGGKAIAYQNGSLIGETYFSDGKGFDRGFHEHRPGTILLHRMLVELHGEGVRSVDYGVGESEYKDVFSNEQSAESRLTTYHPGAVGSMMVLGAQAVQQFQRLGKHASGTRFGRGLRARLVRRSTAGEGDSQ